MEIQVQRITDIKHTFSHSTQAHIQTQEDKENLHNTNMQRYPRTHSHKHKWHSRHSQMLMLIDMHSDQSFLRDTHIRVDTRVPPLTNATQVKHSFPVKPLLLTVKSQLLTSELCTTSTESSCLVQPPVPPISYLQASPSIPTPAERKHSGPWLR